MKKKKRDFKLTEDEQELESEIERGDWKPVTKNEAERLRSQMLEAVQSGNKEARVNLRLNPEDVARIREKAEREGIPYQTLIASVLHKYATDQFMDEKMVTTIVHKIVNKVAGQI